MTAGVTDRPLLLDDVPARRATGAMVAVAGLRATSAACGVVIAAVLSRHLGPEGFGELSVILAVAMIGSSLAELGTTHVAVAEMAADPQRRAAVAAGFAIARMAGGCVMAVAGTAVLVAVLHSASADLAAVAVMATLPLAGISGLVVLAQARLRPQVGAALGLGQSVLWLGCVVAVGAAGASLAAYGVAFLACGVAQAAAAWIAVGRGAEPAWREGRAEAGRLLARTWPLAVAAAMTTIYYRVDTVLVFQLGGAAGAGFYSAAYRFLDVLQLLPAALTSVLLPLLARRWAMGDRAAFQRLTSVGVTVAAAVAVPVVVGAWIAGDRVAVAVFGPRFAASGALLSVLALAFVSIATGYVYAVALIAAGQLRVIGVAAAVAVVVAVTADLVVIPRWDAIGAAWVTVGVEYLVSTTLAVWLVRHRLLRLPWARFGRTALAGFVMGVVGWRLRDMPLAVLLVGSAAAYVAAALASGAVTRGDLEALGPPRRSGHAGRRRS